MRNESERPRILVVDDIDVNRMILQEILTDSYDIIQAKDGMEAISILLNSIYKPNLVLLDIMMPGIDGYEVLKFMKTEETLNRIPVIFITAVNDEKTGLSAGANDYISKPFEPDIVKLRVSNQIELSLYREKLEGLVEQKANELIRTKEHFLEKIANIIEYSSLESSSHVYRARGLAQILTALLLNNDMYTQELIDTNYAMMIKAVPLHDVGKIAIPDNILLKPGRLTPDEFKVIESHSEIGSQIITSLMVEEDDSYLKHCFDICRHHHEKWNGAGYPDKLEGEDIPISARIVAVVDVYDALVNERCYKQAMPHEQAMDIIIGSSGTHFDPNIVEVLKNSHEQFRDFEINDETSKIVAMPFTH